MNADIKLLVLDFDGVLTDNRVLVDENGKEAAFCHRGDGYGIGLLKKMGLPVLVLSTEPNPIVVHRCKKLAIPCIHNCPDKLSAMKEIAQEYGVEAEQIAFVGNDLNDLEALQWVGWPIGVADAVPEVLAVARKVTEREGGDGAVREVCDWIRGSS
jgi:3-deoxy-D-manno-octulosonate 8-phosphate phosphatase (KDO 8-P phosphatase)